MAIAGSLEIQLLADVARLRTDMDKALGIVSRTSKAMEDAASRVRSALGSIGAGVSAAAFGAWIKGAIDLADNLNDLSKSTDLAVGKLAGLKMASRQSGGDLESTAQAINKLSLNIGKNAEKFAAIGITAKAPIEAFKQLSDIFREIDDPQLRAAVAAEALGKSWAGAAPLLSEGSKRIQEMIDKGEALSGMNQDTANSADEFNDRLVELQTALGGTAMKIGGDLLPLLTALVSDMSDTTEKTNGLSSSFNPLTEALRAVAIFGGNVAFVLRGVGIEIGGIAAQMAAFLRGDWSMIPEISREMKADAEANRVAFDAWEQKMLSAGAAAKRTAADTNEAVSAMTAARTAALKAFADEQSANKARAAAKKELAEQAKLMAELSGLTGSFSEDWNRLSVLHAKGALSLRQLTAAQADLLAKQPAIKKAAEERANLLKAEIELQAETAKEIADAYVEEDKARTAARLAVAAYSKGIAETSDELKLELSLVGATEAARKRALALYRIELDLKQQIAAIEDFRSGFNAAQREEEKAKARAAAAEARANVVLQAEIDVAEKVQQEWEETNRQIGESFVDNLMRGGKSVSEYLKDLFRTLVLRPILAPIGSAVAGVAGAALGMPAAAQGVGGSLVGSAAGSAAGSWLGSTMAGGSFLSGVSGASAALAGGSTFGVTGAIGSIPAAIGTGGTGLAGAAGSMGAGVSGALGAIPVWGWALMAGLAIASLAKGGETRSGGAYSDTSFLQGPSGGEINAEATRTAIGSTMQGINEMLRALGSTAQLANLQSGFESSKHGKGFAYAGGQLSTGAVFGQGVGGLGWQNRRGSMTPEEAATAFGEELKQATLQALQEAGVPGILGDYLRSLGDIDALSGGALDAALGRIQQALSEKQALEEQMLTLQSTDLENLTRARERERKALDESNWALYDQVTALMDQKAAAEAAARAAEEAAARQREIDQERYGLETTLLQLQGDTVGLRRRELEALDPSNRALQEYIWTLQDAAVEADKAQAATEKAMQAQQQYRDGLLADVNRTKGELLAGYEREAGALRQTIQAHRQYANDLREFRTSLFLGGDSPLRLNDRTDLAQRQFDVTIAKAQAGDLDAIAQLQGDGTAYLAALKNSALTKFDYSLGVARVAAGLTITAAKSDATATAAQSQLDVMTSQLTALGVLTDVTQQGFAALLANYVGAKNNAAAAGAVQLDQSLTNGVTLGDGTFLSPDFLSSTMAELQQANAIQGLYMDTFGRAADREGLEYHMAQLDRGVTYDQLAAQFAQARLDGSHADGLDYVPFDGYRAELHRGERVLSMSDNAALTSAIERMAVQIEQQGRQIDALVTHSYQSRKHLQEVVERGVGVYNAPGETLETVAA